MVVMLIAALAGTSVFDAMRQSEIPLSQSAVGYTPATAQVRVERENLQQSEVPLKLSLRMRPPPLSRVQHHADTANQAVGLDRERREEDSVRRRVAIAFAHVSIDREVLRRMVDHRAELVDLDTQAETALQEGVIDGLQRLTNRQRLAALEGDLAATTLALASNEAVLQTFVHTDELQLEPWPEVAPTTPWVSDAERTALLAEQRVVRASRLPSLDFIEADVSLDAVPEWGVTLGVGIPLPGRSRELRQLRTASMRASKSLDRRKAARGSEAEALAAQQAHWRAEEQRAQEGAREIRALRASLPAGDSRQHQVARLLYEAELRVLEARRARMLVECRWLSEATHSSPQPGHASPRTP